MISNPYSDVDWGGVVKIPSCSHQHCETQEEFDTIVGSNMYEHYAFSNYYPSIPYYPLSDFFTDIPQNALDSPNAEHHNMNNNGASLVGLHVNGLGCTKTSGSARHKVDGQWVYDQPIGFGGLDWRQAFAQILATQQYQDGGGITINHPSWSNRHGGLPQYLIEQMLAFDSRVLGIEVYNAQEEDYDFDLWDRILKQGIKCFGFAASDHIGQGAGSPKGRNVLLCDSRDAHECLKAYREGKFYCQLHNTELTFTSITYNYNSVSCVTSGASSIDVVIDGKKIRYNTTSVNISIPPKCVYIRFESVSENDMIWSNPIIFQKPQKNSFNNFIPYM